MKPILKIAKELLELERKATPGDWSAYFETGINPFMVTFTENEKGQRTLKDAIRKLDDLELCAQSRNHIRQICEALVEAHGAFSVIQFGGLEENHTATEWLKKWDGANE